MQREQSGPLSDTASDLNDADSCSDLSDFADLEQLEPGDERLAAPVHFAEAAGAGEPRRPHQVFWSTDGQLVRATSDDSVSSSSGLSGGGLSSGGSEEEGEHPVGLRVKLPSSTLRALQLSLAGPSLLDGKLCCSLEGRVRAWAAAGPLVGALYGAYANMMLGVETGVPMWEWIGYAGFVVWVTVGVAMYESTQAMAFAVIGMLRSSDAGSEDGNSPRDGGSLGESLTGAQELEAHREQQQQQQQRKENQVHRANVEFMQRLLRSRVSAPVAAKIQRVVQIVFLQSLAFAAVLEFNFIGLTIYMATWDNAWMMYAMVAVALISVPIMGAIMAGFLLFFRVPCEMAADRIRQEAARVRATDATNADWNATMGAVQEAHETTVRIGALMRPPLMAFQVVGVFAGGWWFACSVIPHDNLPAGHPLRVYFTGLAFLVLTIGAVFTAIYPLYYPAATSLACDDLVAAIKGLCQSNDPVQGHVIASPQNLIRIDGICRYAAELNRGQGLSFAFGRFRIDNRTVTRMLGKTLLAVGLLFKVPDALDFYITREAGR
jgi:hypothetical protein